MNLKYIILATITIIPIIYMLVMVKYFNEELQWFNLTVGKYGFMRIPKTIPDCSNVTLDLLGDVFNSTEIQSWELTWGNVSSNIQNLPKQANCRNKRKVAIIIPYRDREEHLMIFIQHMVPIFHRQNLNYTIFVIEQVEGAPFNRAKLLNIGFVEASKVAEFDCYFFHDVDILLENDNCMYCADDGLKHFSTLMNKFGYKQYWYTMPICKKDDNAVWYNLPYFGGVTRVSSEVMQAVNGMSNIYWGWGAEDDDFYLRILKKGIQPSFNEETTCKFSMAKHSQSQMSQSKNFLLKQFEFRTEFDGLNSLKYKVLNHTIGELFTNITVDIGHPSEEMIKTTGSKFFLCKDGNSWIKRNIFHLDKTNTNESLNDTMDGQR